MALGEIGHAYLNVRLLDATPNLWSRADLDGGETSFSQYVRARARGDDRVIALPLFLMRGFRHRCIVVRRDSPALEAADLDGARIGLTGWADSGNTWTRAILREAGVGVAAATWRVGPLTADHPVFDRIGGVPVGDNVKHTPNDAPLVDLLAAGDLDAVMTPFMPPGFYDPNSPLRPLYPDTRSAEIDYFRRHGFVPGMHVLALRVGGAAPRTGDRTAAPGPLRSGQAHQPHAPGQADGCHPVAQRGHRIGDQGDRKRLDAIRIRARSSDGARHSRRSSWLKDYSPNRCRSDELFPFAVEPTHMTGLRHESRHRHCESQQRNSSQARTGRTICKPQKRSSARRTPTGSTCSFCPKACWPGSSRNASGFGSTPSRSTARSSPASRKPPADCASLSWQASTSVRSHRSRINTLVVLRAGEVLTTYRKLHLYDAFTMRESDNVTAADFLPELFDVGGFAVGLMTCYDVRFPEMARLLAVRGADVLRTSGGLGQGPAQRTPLAHPGHRTRAGEHRLPGRERGVRAEEHRAEHHRRPTRCSGRSGRRRTGHHHGDDLGRTSRRRPRTTSGAGQPPLRRPSGTAEPRTHHRVTIHRRPQRRGKHHDAFRESAAGPHWPWRQRRS